MFKNVCVVALIVTQAENNLSSLLCIINITTINYSIFIEWNIIQHLTQIKKELHVFAGCISEARFIWKKKLNMAKY